MPVRKLLTAVKSRANKGLIQYYVIRGKWARDLTFNETYSLDITSCFPVLKPHQITGGKGRPKMFFFTVSFWRNIVGKLLCPLIVFFWRGVSILHFF